ncbi:PepSY-associated TM helix domain-containing protein [Membranihabitans maritimus]|uniref:PepSY-associated TM helix domain-containing protein n=1 Tax=Membranihabitans maritimus TaxID=2904244 RepID=UPI001F2A0024|nr:PepSY-associated TM helix domain-containing protein [Membranihabitans maritimus]
MKFKGLSNRAYNIVFHTHTVTGLVISIGLFVIFLAGAFALFKEEMYRWENQDARYNPPEIVDLDRALSRIKKSVPNFDPSEPLTIKLPTYENPEYIFYGAERSKDSMLIRAVVQVNSSNYEVREHKDTKTHLGQTLYDLHFFHQIPYVGLFISGFLGLFFVFATLSGLLVHWKHMISKFYAFNIKSSLQQFWKDAHVTLSFIGLPFQLIYGVTGALLGLSILLLLPSVMILFGGSQQEIRGMIDPSFSLTVDENSPLSDNQSLNISYQEFMNSHEYGNVYYIRVQNYGHEDALMSFGVDDRKRMTGDGIYVVRMNTGEVLAEHSPADKSYGESVYGILIKLHYGTFGGLLVKVLYFLLALVTCFVIISGILLWQSSRDNKRYSNAQRKFHFQYTRLCLAICLSLFPAIGLIFLANKCVPFDLFHRTMYVNSIFFTGWLLLSIIGLIYKDTGTLNRFYLLMGAIFSFMIPVANGVVTGDWIWSTLYHREWYVAGVDIFWIFSGITLIFALRNKIDVPPGKRMVTKYL